MPKRSITQVNNDSILTSPCDFNGPESVDEAHEQLETALAQLDLFANAPRHSREKVLYYSDYSYNELQRKGDISDTHFGIYLIDQVSCLETSPQDPELLPGASHAMYLYAGGMRAISPDDIAELKVCLNMFYSYQHEGDRFAVGGLVGYKWRIESKLCGVGGSFNRGIYTVRSTTGGEPHALKVLPSQATYGGFARRETNILHRLRCAMHHPNIISLIAADTPEHRHASPWMITDYCTKGTLETFIEFWNSINISEVQVPELFTWHILESLVEAVRFLHHGPVNTPADSWDGVSHRDIIFSNVFLTPDKRADLVEGEDYPIAVKLADFGCAIMDSEMRTEALNIDELPIVDAGFMPPEGPVATEAADLYQVGLVVHCLMSGITSPSTRKGSFRGQSSTHTDELKMIVNELVSKAPAQRGCATTLLDTIRDTKAILLEFGDLEYEELSI